MNEEEKSENRALEDLPDAAKTLEPEAPGRDRGQGEEDESEGRHDRRQKNGPKGLAL